jgi:acyl-CoA thioesterase YciA
MSIMAYLANGLKKWQNLRILIEKELNIMAKNKKNGSVAKTQIIKSPSANKVPVGFLAIRVLAMPADTNPNGDIFGGWVLSQMDMAGGIVTKKMTGQKTVTVAVNAMEFHLPVLVGDVLCCYVQQIRVGRTSLTVKIEAWVNRQFDNEMILVTEGTFTYVAIDDTRRPVEIKKIRKKI